MNFRVGDYVSTPDGNGTVTYVGDESIGVLLDSGEEYSYLKRDCSRVY